MTLKYRGKSVIDDLTVIIITFQEEQSIRDCVISAQLVTNNIFVVDSYSTDRTQSILNDMGVKFIEHEFISYAHKRNWAQKNNPFKTEWVIHIDADERFTPELSTWLMNDFAMAKDQYDGFMFSRKVLFLNRWIRFGGLYPNFHLRLFKATMGYVEDKAYVNHWVLPGGRVKVVHKADIINNVASNLDDFILSHNRWASNQALEIVYGKDNHPGEVEPKILGNPIERRRWLKIHVFEKSPLFIRSFVYFSYRYFIRLGFLDGKEGLIFFVLQTFWFRFLVDAKVFEVQKQNSALEEKQ